MTDTHRNWPISYYPPPIPFRGYDWQATHPDFDGPEDDRIVTAASREALIIEIDDWYEDQE